MHKEIEIVGSCSTLIAERIRNGDSAFLQLFPDASEMLLATILIDTYKFDMDSGRTTDQDIFTAKILFMCGYITDMDELFTEIQTGFLTIIIIIIFVFLSYINLIFLIRRLRCSS